MNRIGFIRLGTYLIILAIAYLVRCRIAVMPVNFAQQRDTPGPNPQVAEIDKWAGKDEQWLMRELGDPQWQHTIDLPVPHIGVFQSVQDKIESKYAGYRGRVRSMVWQKGPARFRRF
jgi:hypothetical protein